MKKKNNQLIVIGIIIAIVLILNYSNEGLPRTTLVGEQYEEWRCEDVSGYYSLGYRTKTNIG